MALRLPIAVAHATRAYTVSARRALPWRVLRAVADSSRAAGDPLGQSQPADDDVVGSGGRRRLAYRRLESRATAAYSKDYRRTRTLGPYDYAIYAVMQQAALL